MHARKILVFFGGCSTEYAVSLQSAAAVLENLDPARWAPVPVGITRTGAWYYYTGPLAAIPADTWHRDAAHCARCTLDATRGAGALSLRRAQARGWGGPGAMCRNAVFAKKLRSRPPGERRI